MKKKISEIGYKRSVKRFAKASVEAFNMLRNYVKSTTPTDVETNLDRICEIIDNYIELNSNMMDWCNKHNIDPCIFTCDVSNKETEMITPD